MNKFQRFMLSYVIIVILIIFTISYFNEKYDVTLFLTAFAASLTASIFHDQFKSYIPVE